MVLCLDKFQAWIRISQMDLQPLEVHVKDESRTVICWIPSYENEVCHALSQFSGVLTSTTAV
jgi:peroxiredoxin